MPVGKHRPRLLIISPVRDEEAFLSSTIKSVVSQTIRPCTWIIVDDGSTDNTSTIAGEAAANHPWIRLHRRADRGIRSVGAGVIEAFNEGLALVSLDDFDYVCKLDGDMQFEPTYFEHLLEQFDKNPKLGTASGKCWDKTPAGWVSLRTGDDFSLGACKTYRVECFREIGGLVQQVMWDGIDCHRCRMKGWSAQSFHDEALKLYELRPMGSSHRSIIHGRFRWGKGQYFMGTHWLYVCGIAAYRTFEYPYGFGGFCILAGYLAAMIQRINRYEDVEFRRFLRRWQLKKLGLIR